MVTEIRARPSCHAWPVCLSNVSIVTTAKVVGLEKKEVRVSPHCDSVAVVQLHNIIIIPVMWRLIVQ